LGVRLEVFGGWGNPGLKGSWVPTWATGRGSDAQPALPAPQGTEGQLVRQGTGRSDLWPQSGLIRALPNSGFPKCTEKIIISVKPKCDFRINEGKFFLAAFPISMEITSLIEYPSCNPGKGMCATLRQLVKQRLRPRDSSSS